LEGNAGGERGGDDAARAGPDDQVEGRADIEGVDLPAPRERRRNHVEICRGVGAPHATAVEAKDA